MRQISRSPLVRVVNTLERDVFLILEETVELWSQSMESELREDELDIGPDEGAVSCTACELAM